MDNRLRRAGRYTVPTNNAILRMLYLDRSPVLVLSKDVRGADRYASSATDTVDFVDVDGEYRFHRWLDSLRFRTRKIVK